MCKHLNCKKKLLFFEKGFFIFKEKSRQEEYERKKIVCEEIGKLFETEDRKVSEKLT